jgi:hypothetical protein
MGLADLDEERDGRDAAAFRPAAPLFVCFWPSTAQESLPVARKDTGAGAPSCRLAYASLSLSAGRV